MNKDLQEKQYSKQDAQRRLDATLRGAFAGPPTPLKDIPKRDGESRGVNKRADE